MLSTDTPLTPTNDAGSSGVSEIKKIGRPDDERERFVSTPVVFPTSTPIAVVDTHFELLKEATPDDAKTAIAAALATMQSLRGNVDALRAFYTAFEADHPTIPRSTLIQWALRTEGEQAWLTIVEAEVEAEAKTEPPPSAQIPVERGTPMHTKKRRHRRRKTSSPSHPIQTYVSPFHMPKHRQDTSLANTLQSIKERLSAEEWKAYEKFLHETETIEEARERLPAFTQLFQKAFNTTAEDAETICRVFLIEFAPGNDGHGIDRDTLTPDEEGILNRSLALVHQYCTF